MRVDYVGLKSFSHAVATIICNFMCSVKNFGVSLRLRRRVHASVRMDLLKVSLIRWRTRGGRVTLLFHGLSFLMPSKCIQFFSSVSLRKFLCGCGG